jgi:hypothetical protein
MVTKHFSISCKEIPPATASKTKTTTIIEDSMREE